MACTNYIVFCLIAVVVGLSDATPRRYYNHHQVHDQCMAESRVSRDDVRKLWKEVDEASLNKIDLNDQQCQYLGCKFEALGLIFLLTDDNAKLNGTVLEEMRDELTWAVGEREKAEKCTNVILQDQENKEYNLLALVREICKCGSTTGAWKKHLGQFKRELAAKNQ